MVQDERRHVDVQVDDTERQRNQIIDNLRQVYDPEISVNVYDLGLIYNINITDNQFCKITMSLTSPFCPAADQILEDVHYAALGVKGIIDVDVNITFDPQWGPEMMSEDAKLILGIF
jgi:metal-sulfur cluster biosynthetic enzyme